MEVLQTVTRFNNTVSDMGVVIDDCKLCFDKENTRVVLKVKFTADKTVKDIKIDVCTFGEDNHRLNIMCGIPYIKGGMLLEIPSLMAKHAEITVGEVTFEDGRVITYDGEFSSIFATEDAFADTFRFDSETVSDINASDNCAEKDLASKKEEKRLAREKRKEERLKQWEEEEEILELIKTDPGEKRSRRVKVLVVFLVLVLLGGCVLFGYSYKSKADAVYNKAMNLYNSGKFTDAITALEKTGDYKYIGEKQKELNWATGMCYARDRRFAEAAIYFKTLGNYKESRENYRSLTNAFAGIIDGGKAHSVALKTDGTPVYAGSNEKKQLDISNWSKLSRIAAGSEFTIGLKTDGKVLATGDNSDGQCDVGSWFAVSSIAAGTSHTVGADRYGRALATGDNTSGQCDVEEWSDIVTVAAGDRHTVGLKNDGTVVATGNNSKGECLVDEWSNVVSIAAGNGFTVGLTYDGKILFTGDTSRGADGAKEVKNPVFISAGDYNVIVTDIHGHTYAFGGNDRNQNVTDIWKSVYASCGGEAHSLGIKTDGTAFAAGTNDKGQANVESWQGLGVPVGTVVLKKGN